MADTFKVGDGATASIGGDAYPYTIRRVSPNGRKVWASEDDFRGKPGANTYAQADKIGVCIPVEVPEDKWKRFTLRRDGTWREVGTSYVFLSAGRSFRQDPSF